MAIKDRINTAKEVLSDTRSRMVVVLLAIIVVVVLIVAYVKFKRSEVPPAGMGSSMTGVPSITSIPGLGKPTREYAKLQEQQNVQLAKEAARKGTAALPTVVRTTYLDAGASSDSLGSASTAGCGIEELKRARLSGVSASELRCRGCSLAALKAAGFTAGELRAAGFSAAELKAAGFSANDLKNAGFSAAELKTAGFSANELASAGFTAGELKNAGFSDSDLKKVGFSDKEINALNNKKTSCNVIELRKARSRGVKASELRKLGCSAKALRDAGYTAAELKEAGFSAGELKSAGFSAKDLRDAGFSASELKNAGFNVKELADAGFTPDKLAEAGFTPGDLVRAGVVKGGLNTALAEAGSCSVENLKKARASGISATELKKRGCSAKALKAAGYSAAELKAAGFNAAELKAAGFSAKELRAAGFSAKDLRDAGFSAKDLKNAGFNPKELKEAGFSAEDLAAAGCSPEDLKKAGFSDKEIREASIQAAAGGGDVLHYDNASEALGRLSKEKLAMMTDQEKEDFKRQQQAMMMMQANQLFSAWTPVPSQQYVAGEPDVVKSEKVGTSEKKEKEFTLENSDIYKAGSIFFAVLDSEVNSDEQGPVLATVVHGPLKGSKVLGNFKRGSKGLLLQFAVITVPKLDKSINVNAVAIDPNTAKTAMATSVNNHYWLRYGSLFASSFISGLGQAFQNAGGQIETTSGASVVTMPALNTTQKAIVAMGNVGQQFGQALGTKVNMPPTIKVKSGTSIGLLLMADLVVPKKGKK